MGKINNIEQKIPNPVPDQCNECQYFQKTGIIDRFKGKCTFYKRATCSNYPCVINRSPAKTTTEDLDEVEELSVQSNEVMENGGIFSFEGRLKRGQYSVIIFSCFFINILLMAVSSADLIIALLAIVLSLPMMWIALASHAKRWHDLGQSGWMTLTLLIPFINFLIFFYLLLASGTDGDNEYGKNP